MAVPRFFLFNELRFGNSTAPSVDAAKPARFLTPSKLKDLREGDQSINGVFVDTAEVKRLAHCRS